MDHASLIHRAADAIAQADALLIGAGAGMGVDSGLPDFRGPQGFWNAYPPYAKLRLHFVDLANPRWFDTDPALAWGFYGQRRNLYRKTTPHAGFQTLRSWGARMQHGPFVFTSNVDGHFQRAGFDAERIVECHGSIDHSQCTRGCGAGIFAAEQAEVGIDESSMHAHKPWPSCPKCATLARPNILMFGDGDWDQARTAQQQQRLERWLEACAGARLAVVECGAGLAIPTVRHFCERLALSSGGTLIRINARDCDVPSGHIGLKTAALAGLREIDECVRASAVPSK